MQVYDILSVTKYIDPVSPDWCSHKCLPFECIQGPFWTASAVAINSKLCAGASLRRYMALRVSSYTQAVESDAVKA